MPKVYQNKDATLVVSTDRKPSVAAQRYLKQRAGYEAEIAKQRKLGTALGQTSKPKVANGKKPTKVANNTKGKNSRKA